MVKMTSNNRLNIENKYQRLSLSISFEGFVADNGTPGKATLLKVHNLYTALM